MKRGSEEVNGVLFAGNFAVSVLWMQRSSICSRLSPVHFIHAAQRHGHTIYFTLITNLMSLPLGRLKRLWVLADLFVTTHWILVYQPVCCRLHSGRASAVFECSAPDTPPPACFQGCQYVLFIENNFAISRKLNTNKLLTVLLAQVQEQTWTFLNASLEKLQGKSLVIDLRGGFDYYQD